ncbi:MAG: DUF4198 domain-containing protein [Gemmataceae bacterium]|nr:DUF4198 domain-containing protein [Gemmataceae bacterium]
MRKFVVLGLALAACGCGRGPYELAPVSGRVLVDGKPVAGLQVGCEPVGSKENPNPGPGSFGTADADGRFTLATIPDRRPGAVVGKHKFFISGSAADAAQDERGERFDVKQLARAKKIPLRFNDETVLTLDVPPEGTASADFNVSWR